MGGLSKAELDAMVEEATVDAYDEGEQVSGFYTMLEEHLCLPFVTQVLGVEVTVADIDLTDGNYVVAICVRDGFRQAIPVLELPLPEPAPDGAEWIAAYRHWLG
jgi:hypothetical protein